VWGIASADLGLNRQAIDGGESAFRNSVSIGVAKVANAIAKSFTNLVNSKSNKSQNYI
jgi:hypothetical protein